MFVFQHTDFVKKKYIVSVNIHGVKTSQEKTYVKQCVK